MTPEQEGPPTIPRKLKPTKFYVKATKEDEKIRRKRFTRLNAPPKEPVRRPKMNDLEIAVIRDGFHEKKCNVYARDAAINAVLNHRNKCDCIVSKIMDRDALTPAPQDSDKK